MLKSEELQDTDTMAFQWILVEDISILKMVILIGILIGNGSKLQQINMNLDML